MVEDNTSAADSRMVVADNVHKHYGRTHVLRGIDLEVRRGEVCCVIGPSGSGKSTFLRCINHLEKISAGRLWVNGQLLGRYWNLGPQQRLYCPAAWFRHGHNELLILDLHQTVAAPIHGATTLHA